jgi:hypothetical protein
MLVFLTIAGIGFLVLVISLLVGELAEHGGDIVHDFGDHGDLGGHDVEHGHGGPSIFSLRILAAFTTGFGGFGAIARYYEFSYVVSSLAGIVMGVLVAAVVYLVVRFLYTQQASSDVTLASLVGKDATVEVFIPAGSVGKIVLTAKGATVALTARSADGRGIPYGANVTIKEVVGDSAVVQLKEEVRA